MRRIASLAGVSLIAGGITALVLFASAARGAPVDLPLVGTLGDGISVQQTGSNGSGETTTSTTTGGNGSGVTTTSTTSSSSTSSSTSTTLSGTSTSSTIPLPRTDGPTACTPVLSLTVQSVVRGGVTGVGGSCFGANTPIALTLFSDPVSLGTTTSDGNGIFAFRARIPSSVPAGSHTLTAAGGGRSASISLVVSEGLSVTGMSWNLAILGLAMIAAGIIVMAGDRIGRQDLIAFE